MASRPLTKWTTILNLFRCADFVALLVAGLTGHFLRFGTVLPSDPPASLFLYLSSIATLASLQFAGSYRARALISLNMQLSALFTGGIGAMLMILLCGYLSNTLHDYSRIWLVSTMLIGSFLLVSNRILFAAMTRRAMANGYLQERVVIVGANDTTDKIVTTITGQPGTGVAILGVFEDRVNRELPAMGGLSVLGSTDDMLTYVRNNRVDRIVVSLPWIASDRISDLLKKLRTVPVRIDLVPYDMIWEFPAINMERLAGVPVLTVANRKVGEQVGAIKRIEDIVFSSVLILVASPVLLMAALAIRLDSKGPVIFRQKRHGFNNEIFEVYKFRSMKVADSSAKTVIQATRGDSRVTRVGRFLRKSSLDELPQLFNVLQGKMSIVGPRPHAVQHNHQYAAIITEYFARHNVKPGITGWAQVNGLRGETDTDDKMRRRVQYDLHYIEHWSLRLDLKIILMTAVAVWFQDTAY